MRITGGTLKGRIIDCPPGVIRPAMDRMREALFSILGPLHGYSFLDLFSGSGTIALEAYSRGANPVRAVEKDRGKRKILIKNLSLAKETISLTQIPVERFILTWKDSFDYVFLDPPFDYRFKTDLLKKLSRSKLIHPGTKILIHYPAEDKLPEKINEQFHQIDHRSFGHSKVNFYEIDFTESQ